MRTTVKGNEVRFKSLREGEPFILGKFVFVKIHYRRLGEFTAINAVNLEDGRGWCVEDKKKVTPLECLGFKCKE